MLLLLNVLMTAVASGQVLTSVDLSAQPLSNLANFWSNPGEVVPIRTDFAGRTDVIEVPAISNTSAFGVGWWGFRAFPFGYGEPKASTLRTYDGWLLSTNTSVTLTRTHMGFRWRYQDPDNYDYFYFRVHPKVTGTQMGGEASILRRRDGAFKKRDGSSGNDMCPDQTIQNCAQNWTRADGSETGPVLGPFVEFDKWFHVRLEVQGARLTVSLPDAGLSFSYESDLAIGDGSFGFGNGESNSNALFADWSAQQTQKNAHVSSSANQLQLWCGSRLARV